jgi:hypothetical protein
LWIVSDVSRTSNISVSSYLRTAAVQGHDDMGNDMLMARVDLTPMLDGHVSCPAFPAQSAADAPRCSMLQINGIPPPQVQAPST